MYLFYSIIKLLILTWHFSYLLQSHSGMLNGGHYISYACNPNGNWYCYNDSSCREVIAEIESGPVINDNRSNSRKGSSSGCTPLSRRKCPAGSQPQRKGNRFTTKTFVSVLKINKSDDIIVFCYVWFCEFWSVIYPTIFEVKKNYL